MKDSLFAESSGSKAALYLMVQGFSARLIILLQTVRKLAGLGLEVARGATGEGIWAFSASVTI